MNKCKKCGHIEFKKSRTVPQNSYYWGVVIQILSDETGYPPDSMHTALRIKFLSMPDDKTGLMKVVSTTKLDSDHMEVYLENIRRWAMLDLNIYIPDPNQL